MLHPTSSHRLSNCNVDAVCVNELTSCLYILNPHNESCQTPIKCLKNTFLYQKNRTLNCFVKNMSTNCIFTFLEELEIPKYTTIAEILAIDQQVDMNKTKSVNAVSI